MRKITNQTEFNYSREYIISNSCAIELLMNFIISGYYFKEHNYDFTANVLSNQYVTNAFRINLLEHVIKESTERNTNIGKIRELFNIRNLYAHNLPSEVTKDDEIKFVFSNPKGTKNEPKIAEEEADRFFILKNEIEIYLKKVILETKSVNNFSSEAALKYELGDQYLKIKDN